MLFLLTKKQKDKILDEYYSRLIYIFSFGLIFLFIVFVIVLFPSYLSVKVDKKILIDKIEPLKTEVENYKVEDNKSEALEINNNLSILNTKVNKDALIIYKDIQSVYKEIPNVEILSINVDPIAKKVSVSANVNNKNTANLLVDRLNNSRYKGAELPYSVFSQNNNFVFNLSLIYE